MVMLRSHSSTSAFGPQVQASDASSWSECLNVFTLHRRLASIAPNTASPPRRLPPSFHFMTIAGLISLLCTNYAGRKLGGNYTFGDELWLGLYISPHWLMIRSMMGRCSCPTLTFSSFRTTSMLSSLSSTRPNTTCLPLRCGVAAVVMKNCDPFLSAPLF